MSSQDLVIGCFARKCGMTSFFNESGELVAGTVLQIDKHLVLGVKTKAKHGYNALVIGSESKKEKHAKKPQVEELKKHGLAPTKNAAEFRLPCDVDLSQVQTGTEIDLSEFFKVGLFVDITGTTKGKGFAGVVKRYGFAGQEASHGHSVSHRSHGSTGQRQDPGKVFKNKKMAGHMGDEKQTIQNLRILKVDTNLNIVIVSGSVPGASGSLLRIKSAIKKSSPALQYSNGNYCFNGLIMPVVLS